MDRGMNCWQLSQPCSQHSTRWKGPRKETRGHLGFQNRSWGGTFSEETQRASACEGLQTAWPLSLLPSLSRFIIFYDVLLLRPVEAQAKSPRSAEMWGTKMSVHSPLSAACIMVNWSGWSGNTTTCFLLEPLQGKDSKASYHSAQRQDALICHHEIEEMLLSFANLISFDLTCITNHTWDSWDIDPARPWRDWSGESSCKSFPGEPWDRELELLLFFVPVSSLSDFTKGNIGNVFRFFPRLQMWLLPSSQQVWLWC